MTCSLLVFTNLLESFVHVPQSTTNTNLTKYRERRFLEANDLQLSKQCTANLRTFATSNHCSQGLTINTCQSTPKWVIVQIGAKGRYLWRTSSRTSVKSRNGSILKQFVEKVLGEIILIMF